MYASSSNCKKQTPARKDWKLLLEEGKRTRTTLEILVMKAAV